MKIDDFEIIVHDEKRDKGWEDITGECDCDQLFIGNGQLYAVYIPPPISNLGKNSKLVAIFYGSELVYLNNEYKIFMIGLKELKVESQ